VTNLESTDEGQNFHVILLLLLCDYLKSVSFFFSLGRRLATCIFVSVI